MDRDVERENDEDQHMHRINDAHSAKKVTTPAKRVRFHSRIPVMTLNGKQQEHDNLVGHGLQRIELAIDAHMKRIGQLP